MSFILVSLNLYNTQNSLARGKDWEDGVKGLYHL